MSSTRDSSAPSTGLEDRAAAAPAWRIEGLSIAWSGRPVLDGLSLPIEPGVTVLLGPNGSGKSTLLGVLAGRLRPTRGRVLGRGRVGYAAQSLELDPDMTVGQHLALFSALQNADPKAATRESSLASRLGLHALSKKDVATLSGGQKRRLHLALSELGAPESLLWDEPTAGLDEEAIAELIATTVGRSARAAAIEPDRPAPVTLIATHDFPFAERIADRIVWANGPSPWTLTPHAGEDLRAAYEARFGRTAIVAPAALREGSSPRPGRGGRAGGGGGSGRGGGGGGGGGGRMEGGARGGRAS